MTYLKEIENLIVNNTKTPYRIISMPMDGSCLFHSIAYSLYNSINYKRTNLIRAKIVNYVCANWDEYNAWSVNRQGEPYESIDIYRQDMLKFNTYGSVCELKAAGCLYPIRIEVYRNGQLEGVFGEEDRPVKRFRFKGHLLRGHYDVCLPLDKLFNQTEFDEYIREDETETQHQYLDDLWYPGRNKGGRNRKNVSRKQKINYKYRK